MVELQMVPEAELLKELVRRGNTFAGEVRLLSWRDDEKGSFSKFMIDQFEDGERAAFESPFKGCATGTKGQRFFQINYMIAEQNEAALSVPKAVSTPSAPNDDPSCKDADSKRTWDQLSYTERANKLIYNPLFHEFAGITPDQALDYVRGQCGVKSRTEILPDTEHARALDTLVKAFRDWQFEQRYT